MELDAHLFEIFNNARIEEHMFMEPTKQELQQQLTAQAGEVVALKEALEPFSKLPGFYDIEEDDVVIFTESGVTITTGNIRKAREVLRNANQSQE